MSWKDNLVPASFRGISFKISSSSADFGRRNVSHEYPLRETPYNEDLGRKKQEFTIEAFVIGDDYIQQRDRLIRACEQQAGRGRLEHPYYGTKFVTCDGCRVTETTEEGRMARLSLTFIEAGEKRYPAAATDFFSKLGVAGDGLLASAQNHFSSAFNVLGYPNFVLEQASESINLLATSLKLVGGVADNTASFTQNIDNLLSDFESLAQTPAELAQEIVDCVLGIGDIGLDIDGITDAYKLFLNFGSKEAASIFAPGSGEISGTREQINTNRDVINDLVIMTAISQVSVTAVEKSRESPRPGKIVTRDYTPLDPLRVSAQKIYPTYESIIVERREILDAIESQMERTLNDDLYQSLQSQKRALIQAFPDPDIDLPSLITFENIQTQPCLVIAYDIYEKLEMETDIIKRNDIVHPGFVPGGSLLEVISNG